MAQDTWGSKSMRQTVLHSICSHIRQTTRDLVGIRESTRLQPSEEMQSLLTLLFVQEHDVFTGLSHRLARAGA